MNNLTTLILAVTLSVGGAIGIDMSGIMDAENQDSLEIKLDGDKADRDIDALASKIDSLQREVRDLKIELSGGESNDAQYLQEELDNIYAKIAELEFPFDSDKANAPMPTKEGGALGVDELEAVIERVREREKEEERAAREQARAKQSVKDRERFVEKIDEKVRKWAEDNFLSEVQIQEVVDVMAAQRDARSKLFDEMREKRDNGESFDRDAMMEEMATIRMSAETSLQNSLTDDQYSKFSEVAEDIYRESSGHSWGRSTGSSRGGSGGDND